MKKTLLAASAAALCVTGFAAAPAAAKFASTTTGGGVQMRFDDRACTIKITNNGKHDVTSVRFLAFLPIEGKSYLRRSGSSEEITIAPGTFERFFFDKADGTYSSDSTSPGERFESCGKRVKINIKQKGNIGRTLRTN